MFVIGMEFNVIIKEMEKLLNFIYLKIIWLDIWIQMCFLAGPFNICLFKDIYRMECLTNNYI